MDKDIKGKVLWSPHDPETYMILFEQDLSIRKGDAIKMEAFPYGTLFIKLVEREDDGEEGKELS